ncbi:MAG: beta-galactosidase, partial [Armatimonadota bacterium]
VNVPWLHDGLWPWTGLIEDQYRRAGVTSTSNPRLNFLLTVSLETPGFGVYWYRRQPYLRQKAQYRRTKDTKYLVRVPCIHTEEFRGPVARTIRKNMPRVLKYNPLAYYLADESSITCYEDALDLCWSEATLAEFRKWLGRQYGNVEKLNAEWGTRYRSWAKVMPVTWEEAQKRGNPAPWVDHRLFMNRTLADGFRYACSIARRIDAESVLTISGTQAPGSHNGCDWWQLDRIIDYLQPYSGGGQDEMHRSFNPDLILTGFTGYALSGMPLEYEVWHRFFHGQRGASIFWGYTIVDPDLTLSPQGKSLEKVFGEMRGEGISRTVNALRREHDKIAIHFSMASGHVWWIQDGKLTHKDLEYGKRTSKSFARFMDNRTSWGQLLEDLGYQYNYVSYEQIEKGELAKAGFRALVLPASIALSEKEARAIRVFVKGGGLVIADVEPGTTDGHGKRLEEGALADVFAGPRCGRVRAVCLNRWLEDYSRVRVSRAGEALRDKVREALEKARVRPRARVAGGGGRHPVGVERVSWRGGGVEVVGLLKEMKAAFRESADGTSGFVVKKGMAGAERARVELPAEGHWYDLRAHKYLGEKAEVRTTLREAEPKLYARLPYRVRGMSLSASGGRAAGEVVRYEAKVKAGAVRPVRHVLKLEVFGPGGKKRPLYSRNVDARGGAAKGEFRLALNDAAGKWRLVVTDVFSGEKAEKSWTVR